MTPLQPVRSWRRAILTAGLLLAWATWAQGAMPAVPAVWQPLARRLAADGHDAPALASLFADPRMAFDPQVMAARLRSLLAARRAPPAGGAAVSVYPGHLTLLAVAGAYGYLFLYRDVLDRTEAAFGVEREVLVAILLVESRLGLARGGAPALTTLASMAAAQDFELLRPHLRDLQPGQQGFEALPDAEQDWLRSRAADRAGWAYREVKALLEYARRTGQHPLDIPGSSAGAIGQAQFMPSSALAYGADGDGDGRVDLSTAADALASIGSFLKAHGWRPGLPRQRREEILLRYNRDGAYARTVLQAAERLMALP